jgi:hypothetical protein
MASSAETFKYCPQIEADIEELIVTLEEQEVSIRETCSRLQAIPGLDPDLLASVDRILQALDL